MPKNLQFRVSSSIKSIIGRDLITNDFVAIFELVKNSVDAGAKNVLIYFDFENDIEPRIFIVDDGKGMSFEDIQKKWLFLGYSAKREGTEDESAKIYAGNKGVGRFSCDRLGATLSLQTRSNKDSIVNFVTVEWGDFEINSLAHFTDIDIEYDELVDFQVPEFITRPAKGVVLEIGKLREEASWTRRKLLDLKYSLQKLINPFGDSDERVQIEVRCPRESKEDNFEYIEAKKQDRPSSIVNGRVKNEIVDTLEAKTTWLRSYIDESGQLYFELHDRGELIYRTKEQLPEGLEPLTRAKYNADIYFLNRSAKATFARRMGINSRDFGSLFLIRNDFRVFPVGDEGTDYWGLDRRKTQGHARFLGNRDIMGRIIVSGSEDDFKESSSRDKGLIDSPAALALKECVLFTIRRLERYVVGVSWKDAIDKDFDSIDRMMIDSNRARIISLISDLANSSDIEVLEYNHNIVDILSEKSEEFEPSLGELRKLAIKIENPELAKRVEKAEKVLKKAKDSEFQALALAEKEEAARRKAEGVARKAEVEREVARKAYKEEVSRNLFLRASSSRDKEHLENFIHQMIYFAAHNKQLIQNQIQSISKKEGNDWKKVLDGFYELREGIEKIIVTSRYLTSAEFRLKSGRTDGDLIGFMVEHLEKMAPLYISGLNIRVLAPDKQFDLNFPPIEIGMILDNLISNSKKARASEIQFEISMETKIMKVIVSDNGRGLAEDILEPEMIFDRGVTRTRGSGLGLHFCREQMRSMSGEIALTNPQPMIGFSVTLTFTK